MTEAQGPDPRRFNTIAMLGQAYSLWGFRIVDGVVGSGHPIRPSHSAVFAQIGPEGSRLSDLAAKAHMTPQSMGEIVDQLEELGYVQRRLDPTDRRAKLITLTAAGREVVDAGEATITGLEEEIADALGEDGYQELRRMLFALVTAGPPEG